jgi:hypothetical protein
MDFARRLPFPNEERTGNGCYIASLQPARPATAEVPVVFPSSCLEAIYDAMTFLLVLGGVAGAVAGVALITVGVWACTGERVGQRAVFLGRASFHCIFISVSVCLRRSSEADLHTSTF